MSIDWDQFVLEPLMSEDMFGCSANYRPKDGWSFDIEGVFDDGYKAVSLFDGEAAISTSGPVLGVRLALFEGRAKPRQGDQVEVKGRVYFVRNPRPDGKGHVLLELADSEDV